MNIKKAPNIILQISEIVSKWNEFAEEVKVYNLLRNPIDNTLIKKTA